MSFSAENSHPLKQSLMSHVRQEQGLPEVQTSTPGILAAEKKQAPPPSMEDDMALARRLYEEEDRMQKDRELAMQMSKENYLSEHGSKH